MPIRVIIAILLLLGLGTYAEAKRRKDQPLQVVPELDLERYSGLWYEMARLPNWFENKCSSDAQAQYSFRPDGTLEVVNSCRNRFGRIVQARGIARRGGFSGAPAKLKVCFAPSLLSFIPFAWADYWVMALGESYEYAVIGEPGRRYLWILSRTADMDESKVRDLLSRASEQGYDLSRLIRTNHTAQPV